MFTPAIWIIFIQSFNWGSSLADYSWENNPVINVTVLDHVFCQQEQIKATFCIHCGSDFPDSVAVSNDTNGEHQMLCVPPEWMCSGPIKGTYNTTSDALEISFIFNQTVYGDHYLRIIHEINGSQEYQQIPLKQYNNPVINVTILDHVFCEQEQIKATLCIHCGSDFPDSVAVSIVKGEDDTNVEHQMLCVPPEWMCSGPIIGTYNITSDALEISFIFNQTVYEDHYLRIIHERNGSQEYQQIPLKQYKQSIINHHVNGVGFWQKIRRKRFLGIRFYPLRLIRLRLRGDGDLANMSSIFSYDTLNDALEMNFPFNLTVLKGYCIRIIHYGNGNQEYQQLLKRNNNPVINVTVLEHVFCQQKQIKATFCIHCGSDFPDSVAVSIVKGEDDTNGEYQMLCVPPEWMCSGPIIGTYNITSDALDISFIFNFTAYEDHNLRIIHERNGRQEYQQIPLKQYSVTIAAYLQQYCALSSSRNAAKQRCTLPVGSCLHHVLRQGRQTYHTECPHYGYYGKNCENRCSDNCYLTRCDRVTGRCNRGCKPGWTTATCKQKCPIGTFGPNCRQECGHCIREDQCHFINGNCLKGCSSGYKGKRCKYQCSTDYFGSNCSNKCSAYCRGNSSCNHITGVCNEGCKAGWSGDKCGRTSGDSTNAIPPILAGYVLQVAVFAVVICVF